MKWILEYIGRLIAAYLQKPAAGYEPFTPTDPAALRAYIKPGDILLIEDRNHISRHSPEYLTQSTWSHAALYVGPIAGDEAVGGEPCELVESNLDDGIICVPLSKYSKFHTRICRPIALSSDDCKAVCNYAIINESDFNTTSRNCPSILRVTWCRCPSHSAGGDE